MSFRPTKADCISLVFGDGSDVSVKAIRYCGELGINNIRVLKRIHRNLNYLLPFTEGLDPLLEEQIFHSTVLLTWSYNSRQADAPDYDFVKKLGVADMFSLDVETTEDDTEEKEWRDRLWNYKYTSSDEIDLEICRFLENGYLDSDLFRTVLNQKNKELTQTHTRNKFEAAWRLFHDSFNDNEAEFIEELSRAFHESARWISRANVDAAVRILRDLDRSELADKFIAHWIDVQSRENASSLTAEPDHFDREIRDESLRVAIENAADQNMPIPTLDEIVPRIAGNEGWGQKDEEFLSTASVDDFYYYFKRTEDRNLTTYVRTCLKFGQFLNPTGPMRTISGKAIEALRRIESESKLNELRIRKFGLGTKPDDARVDKQLD